VPRAAVGGAAREQFTANLHGETGLGNTWIHGFVTRPVSPDSINEQENGSPS